MTSITEEWKLSKIAVATAVQRGKAKEARKYLTEMHAQFAMPESIEGEIRGMLFILDLILTKKAISK